MRDYESKLNLSEREKEVFSRLKDISFTEFIYLVDHSIKQDKYSIILKMVVTINNKYHRYELSQKIISHYWTKLKQYSLLETLFVYADFETFVMFFKKQRSITESQFIMALIRTDSIENVKWIVKEKKFLDYIEEESLHILSELLPQMSYKNEETLKILLDIPKVKEMVLELKLENLYPQEIQDVFLF